MTLTCICRGVWAEDGIHNDAGAIYSGAIYTQSWVPSAVYPEGGR